MNAVRGFQYPDGTHTPLSNFFPCPIFYVDREYPTNEHAFQAAKSLDPNVRDQIAAVPTPGEAKRLGRALALRADWEAIKIPVMRSIVRVKFEIPTLSEWLLGTGDAYLEETNTWHDVFWGVCDEGGQNWLGFLLMGVRAELRSGVTT